MKVKKRKKLNKSVIILIVLIIIILLPFVCFVSVIKDKNDSKEVMNIIKKDYKAFQDDVVSFNTYRDKVYDEIFADSDYNTFKEKSKDFDKFFINYEKLVNKIKKNSNQLITFCDGIYYTDIDVNTMCLIFGDNYETLYNSFIIDVKHYNTLVKEYNTYLEKNNLSEHKLNNYKTNKKYIDYNHDKKYSGKE